MQLTPSGHAVVGFRESCWFEDKTTNDWAGLAVDLKTNEVTLAAICVALQKPILNSELDYSLGFMMPITNLVPAKSLTYWFGAGSQLSLHEGKPHESVDYLVANIGLPRLLVEDRVAISELMRDALAAIAKSITWEAMQADHWTDADLARIQEAWQGQVFATNLIASLEGERVYGDVSFDLLRQSNEQTVNLINWSKALLDGEQEEPPFWKGIPFGDEVATFIKEQVYCRIWRFAWSYQAQRRGLEQQQRLIEISRTAAREQSMMSVRPAINKLVEELDSRNWYDQLRYPRVTSILNLSRVVDKALRAETERSMAVCAVALKRYSLRHGQLPASLDALVPEFLPAVPTDYMDGQPMKYHLNPDGSFVLYSVGENGTDDGGDVTLLPDRKNFWNLWDRRDFVWPAPASPEETEAYRKEALKD
jgi:hypothetical protein